MSKKTSISVSIYSKNNHIYTFNSMTECSNKSKEIIGIKVSREKLSNMYNKDISNYNDFIFKFNKI